MKEREFHILKINFYNFFTDTFHFSITYKKKS